MNATKLSHDRVCPRCAGLVRGERLDEGTAQTWLWRCPCGWSQLISESGVMNRRNVREMIRQSNEEKK